MTMGISSNKNKVKESTGNTNDCNHYQGKATKPKSDVHTFEATQYVQRPHSATRQRDQAIFGLHKHRMSDDIFENATRINNSMTSMSNGNPTKYHSSEAKIVPEDVNTSESQVNEKNKKKGKKKKRRSILNSAEGNGHIQSDEAVHKKQKKKQTVEPLSPVRSPPKPFQDFEEDNLAARNCYTISDDAVRKMKKKKKNSVESLISNRPPQEMLEIYKEQNAYTESKGYVMSKEADRKREEMFGKDYETTTLLQSVLYDGHGLVETHPGTRPSTQGELLKRIEEMTTHIKVLEQFCFDRKIAPFPVSHTCECPDTFLNSLGAIKKRFHQLQQECEDLTLERNDFMTRLSRVAGNRLTENNPNVTDLNDPKRPMQLADKLSKMYDDDWTDAMEMLAEKQQTSDDHQEKCVHLLFSIVTAVYESCKQKANRQLRGIIEHTFLLDSPSDEQVNAMLDKNDRKKIIDDRKNRADISIQMLQQTLKEDRIFTEEIQKCRPRLEDDMLDYIMKSSYFMKCIEVCWYFVIQDPPMYLETINLRGTLLNRETHMEFTAKGNLVKYNVWPALYLHNQDIKGPLMKKGVVQPE